MSEYLEFWRCYADFKGKTTRRSFWIAIVIWCNVALVLMMALLFAMTFALKLEPEQAVKYARLVYSCVYGLTSVVPLLAISVRRLRDAGYSTKSFWWLLIPGIGQIAYFARLCSKSK